VPVNSWLEEIEHVGGRGGMVVGVSERACWWRALGMAGERDFSLVQTIGSGLGLTIIQYQKVSSQYRQILSLISFLIDPWLLLILEPDRECLKQHWIDAIRIVGSTT
jgi:ABC-type uncharacterized transport system permease subunit